MTATDHAALLSELDHLLHGIGTQGLKEQGMRAVNGMNFGSTEEMAAFAETLSHAAAIAAALVASPKTDNTRALRRAIDRQAKDAAGWKWDADNECAAFFGQFNSASVQAYKNGFRVDVWNGTSQPIVTADYKTLGAALRNGRMYSNSNYDRAQS